MRVYADADDQLGSFSLSLGFFVIGTTHYDHNECAPTPWFGIGHWSGHSEDAEEQITDDIEDNFGGDPGWTFARDAFNLKNAEHGRRGSHRQDNNGLATKISMPPPT